MQQTPNYALKKIELTDSPPDITVINPNWDTIDTKLKENANQLAGITNYMLFELSSSQGIPNDTPTDIVFGITEKSSSQIEDFAQITAGGKIKLLESGMYALGLYCRLQNPTVSTGYWFVSMPDASQLIPLTSGIAQYMKLFSIVNFTANQELTFNIRQTKGSSLNLEVASLRIIKVGDVTW